MLDLPRSDIAEPPYRINLNFPSCSRFWRSGTATSDDIKRLKKYYPEELYKNVEDSELRNGSNWRRDQLWKLKNANKSSFREKFPNRYNQWLQVHWNAITWLQAYFTESEFVGDEDVPKLLLQLWAFLPTDWSADGMSYDCQISNTTWFTEKTTHEERDAIDFMLDSLLENLLQENGNVEAKKFQKRLNLFETFSNDSEDDSEDDGKSLQMMKISDMVKTGALRTLLKRLLLQTPLLFWPGIFLPEIIDKDLIDQLQKQPWLSTVEYGRRIIRVKCKGNRSDGGAEVLGLWIMTTKKETVSRDDVKACGKVRTWKCTAQNEEC
jgi:hypothetical protein